MASCYAHCNRYSNVVSWYILLAPPGVRRAVILQVGGHKAAATATAATATTAASSAPKSSPSPPTLQRGTQ